MRLIEIVKNILMIPGRLVSAFLQQATAQGSRSTILRPLQWMTLLFVLALVACVYYKGPNWLIIALFVLLVAPLAAVLVAFFYCLFSGNDSLLQSLRTEHYAIQKLAIEKGYRGDNTTGLIVATSNSQGLQVVREAVEQQSEGEQK